MGWGNLRCDLVYREPSPSSWCRPASLRFIIAMSSKSAYCSKSRALPYCICRKFSRSSRLIAICLRLPPYFLSKRSFAASYAVAECPRFSITLSASPERYWWSCSNLYSPVAGALSMQARKAAFQLWYVLLSPVNTGICTHFYCLQRSCPIDEAAQLACGSNEDPYRFHWLFDSYLAVHVGNSYPAQCLSSGRFW